MEQNNIQPKTCDHQGCSIKSLCYIPGLNSYFCIKHCLSPCKDTYPKCYFYHNFTKGHLGLLKNTVRKIKEYMDHFKTVLLVNNIKARCETEESKRDHLDDFVTPIFEAIDSEVKPLCSDILHFCKDLVFQKLLNTQIIYANLNAKCDNLLSWDQINSTLSDTSLPKVKNFEQYFDGKTMLQLLSMTQEHFEEFLGKEDTPSFAKNILRAFILEVFYQTQRHHEHINSNLDSNFFILFFNVIEDFQLQKDFLKYMKLFKTKSKLIENYSYPKLIISKFIEYQSLEELKYALQKPQKLYDETSLNFHIPNILTIYKNLCAVECQVNSQVYEQAYKQIDKSDFYEYRNDLNCENFTHKMTNKPFKCAHSRTCKNSPFYFLPECDKTLCLTHRLERAYDQYSKFEPLHRCSFIGMAYLVENLQQYYFGLYSTHFSNAKKQTKQEAVLGIKRACYGLSFILREIICKCYCHSLDLRTRIGELNTTDKIVNILMSLLEKNEI